MTLEIGSGLLQNLSDNLGTTVPALKLLLSILSGYGFALIYRKFLCGKSATIQHIYFILSGVSIGYFNYGVDFCHSIIASSITYISLLLLGGNSISVGFIFIYNMLHLIAGYYFIGTDNYDINWTMPQCILVLRLIGIAYDYYDGQQNFEQLGAENKKVALRELPGLLEYYGFVLFPSSFLVGPQYPMKRYQQYVRGEFGDPANPRCPPKSSSAAIHRFLLGFMYLVTFQILGLIINDDVIISPKFRENSPLMRMVLMGVWGRYTLYRYISCWLLTEGACILFGISYNGVDETGQVQWNGVANVKLRIFENTLEFNDYIRSFNTNTNQWVAQYVYKRLKFLGNRHISQLASLAFLAVWHGLHSGYYLCFFLEFTVVYMERDLKTIVKNNKALSEFFAKPWMGVITHIVLRFYTFVFMGYCLLPFVVLKFDRYWYALGSVYYSGFILWWLWPVVYAPVLRLVFKKDKSERDD